MRWLWFGGRVTKSWKGILISFSSKKERTECDSCRGAYPGQQALTQLGRLWVNFLEHCFLLPLSSQAVDISFSVCTVPHTAFQNLPLCWLLRLAAHCSVLNWAWGKEQRVHRNAKEGSLRQATPSQDSCFWSDCIITGDLSMEPGFAQDGLKIIMSVMGSGRTKYQWRELDWSCAGDR